MKQGKKTGNPGMAEKGAGRFVVTILAGERPGRRYVLPADGDVAIGRNAGGITFPSDPCIADLHGVFSVASGRVTLKVCRTAGGIYRRLGGEMRLMPGDLFTVARHHLRFLGTFPDEADGDVYGAKYTGAMVGVEEILKDGVRGKRLVRPSPRIIIGRDGCDLNFENDWLVSERHCELSLESTGAFLRDLGSNAGTFLRIGDGEEVSLQSGDQLRLGDQFIQLTQE